MGAVDSGFIHDSERMAVLYDHVIGKGHTVKITPQGDNFVEVACTSEDGSCGEGHEAWWDHWDFDESYAARLRHMLGDEGKKL